MHAGYRRCDPYINIGNSQRLIFCLKIWIDCAFFASQERLFQSFALLYLKLFLGIPFLVLGELNQYSYFLNYNLLALIIICCVLITCEGCVMAIDFTSALI